MRRNSFFIAIALLTLMVCTTARSRLLADGTTAADSTHSTAGQLTHASSTVHSSFQSVMAYSVTGAQWGTIIGTGIGVLMLTSLWAIRCCLKRFGSEADQLSDVDRPTSPLLTPRTPQSPRSEGRRSWSHTPPPPSTSYSPPPVKLLDVPQASLDYVAAASSSTSVLLFTKEQLISARDSLCAAADRLITSVIQSGEPGSVRSWLLKDLPSADDVSSSNNNIVGQPGAADEAHTPTAGFDSSQQLKVAWARHHLWQWLQDHMWGGLDNPLVARGKVQGSALSPADEGVTKTQAARELLSAIKKNSNHKAFKTAVTVFSQQLVKEMLAEESAATEAAEETTAVVNEVMEMALMFQLQMLGTSAGMQTYVPGDSSDNTGAPEGAVMLDDGGGARQGLHNTRLLCTKPGVLELKSLGGGPHTVVILQAHAVTCA